MPPHSLIGGWIIRSLGPAVLWAAVSTAAAGEKVDLIAKCETLAIHHETEHYLLAGSISQKRLEEFGQCLEYIYAEYTRGFDMLLNAERKPDQPPGPKGPARQSDAGRPAGGAQPTATAPAATRFHVAVLATKEEYVDFYRVGTTSKTEYSRGMFIPDQKLLLILDQEHSAETYEILFHEAFHQFIHRYVKNPPLWLNEGLATYFGTASPKPGGLVFDRPREAFWDICRRVVRKGSPIPLADVVQANRDTFYDHSSSAIEMDGHPIVKSSIYYAEAYTLVHMLLADPDAKNRLHDYVRDLAADDGRHTREITAKHFGPETCARLMAPWQKWVLQRAEKR